MRVIFRRSTDADFIKKNKILKKNEVVCILTEEQIKVTDIEKMKDFRVRYKIGDGKHHYRDLPFEEGTIPVVIEIFPNTEKRY